MKKNYLTKDWYDSLLEELRELKNEKLNNVLERLAEAKSMWDLSENFEYKSALEDKDFIMTRVAEIEDLIEDVEIITEDKKTSSKSKTLKEVDYGSKVTLKVEWEKEYNATIVGTWEISLSDDGIKISLESPLWLAIKWKKAGDVVKMRLHNGKIDVKIISVS